MANRLALDRTPMTARVCHDCPTIITTGTRCTTCAKTTSQRGYGRDHQAERARHQARMDAGHTYNCWRCSGPITPEAWHLGHDDNDRTADTAPECITCNTATATRIPPRA